MPHGPAHCVERVAQNPRRNGLGCLSACSDDEEVFLSEAGSVEGDQGTEGVGSIEP